MTRQSDTIRITKFLRTINASDPKAYVGKHITHIDKNILEANVSKKIQEFKNS